MPMILPHGLTAEEIRVLQEFRRLTSDTLPLEKIQAIKHPAGTVAETPAVSLVAKGFLTAEGENFTVTERAKEFLAIDAKPMVEETGDSGASAAASPQADGA